MTSQPTGQGRPLSPGITAHVSARHANPCRDKARLVSIATPHVPARHATRRDRACPVSTRQTSCGRARISVRAEIKFRYNGNKIPCLRKNISARTEFRMPTNHTPPALRATSPGLGSYPSGTPCHLPYRRGGIKMFRLPRLPQKPCERTNQTLPLCRGSTAKRGGGTIPKIGEVARSAGGV